MCKYICVCVHPSLTRSSNDDDDSQLRNRSRIFFDFYYYLCIYLFIFFTSGLNPQARSTYVISETTRRILAVINYLVNSLFNMRASCRNILYSTRVCVQVLL